MQKIKDGFRHDEAFDLNVNPSDGTILLGGSGWDVTH